MREAIVKRYRMTIAHNQYGHPEPRIEVQFEAGTEFRRQHAALHVLAAAVELATPPEEGWITQLVAATSDCAGRVYLELLHATEEEARRGYEMLQRVCRAQYSEAS